MTNNPEVNFEIEVDDETDILIDGQNINLAGGGQRGNVGYEVVEYYDDGEGYYDEEQDMQVQP